MLQSFLSIFERFISYLYIIISSCILVMRHNLFRNGNNYFNSWFLSTQDPHWSMLKHNSNDQWHKQQNYVTSALPPHIHFWILCHGCWCMVIMCCCYIYNPGIKQSYMFASCSITKICYTTLYHLVISYWKLKEKYIKVLKWGNHLQDAPKNVLAPCSQKHGPYLCLFLTVGLFPSGFSNQNFVCIHNFPHVLHVLPISSSL